MVDREVAEYHYQVGPGLLGRPMSDERVRAELAALRRALVPPVLVDLHLEPEHGGTRVAAWLVAQEGPHNVVVFSEVAGEYVLAHRGRDGSVHAIGVQGDLVGCFMAR
jgi:hypothetical protein